MIKKKEKKDSMRREGTKVEVVQINTMCGVYLSFKDQQRRNPHATKFTGHKYPKAWLIKSLNHNKTQTKR